MPCALSKPAHPHQMVFILLLLARSVAALRQLGPIRDAVFALGLGFQHGPATRILLSQKFIALGNARMRSDITITTIDPFFLRGIITPLFPSTLFPHRRYTFVSAKTRALQGRSSRYKPRPCKSLPAQSYVASPSQSFSRHWRLPSSANGSRTWHWLWFGA